MNCPSCNRPLPADAPGGLCPQCLVRGGLGTHANIDPASTAADVGRQPRFTPPPVEEIADIFPQLEVLEFAGQGGMGAVYKARQKQLDRIVALKILPPDIGDDPAFSERFTREAKAMARLSHPGIVTIHDFGQEGGLFYFVMEYIDGLNLGELLRRGQVSPKEALQIVPQICEALQYAHDQGIVHRDIKPENILLDRQGHVKVADFGLAKLMGTVEEATGSAAEHIGPSTLTTADKVMGTPQYMAPEQRERPLEVDHRADVYSVGVVFYQLLTGELPHRPIEPPSQRVQIDVRLDEVVLRALEQEPDRRYQQASVLKTRVETIASTPPPERHAQSPPAASVSASPQPPLQIWVVTALLAFEICRNLAAIPHDAHAGVWLAVECLFVVGLIRRWRWVFVLILISSVSNFSRFLPVNPLFALLNLAWLVLTASAWRFYLPPVPGGQIRVSQVVQATLIALVAALLIGAVGAYGASWLYVFHRPRPAKTAYNPSQPVPPPILVAEMDLMNPGMEEGEEGPLGWLESFQIPDVEYVWDRSVGHDSQSSLCLHKTVDLYYPIAQWSQTIPREGNSPMLQVSVQVKAEEVTKAIVDVIFVNEDLEPFDHEWASYIGAVELNPPPLTHDWKEYTGHVTIPEGTEYIRIGLQIYGPGKVWFDDVRADYAE